MARKKIKVVFTDWWSSKNFMFEFLSRNFDIEISEKPDFVIYSVFGKDFLNYDCIRIFYTGENIRPNFKECDYGFGYDYLANQRYFRLPLYRFTDGYESLFRKKDVNDIMRNKTRFCNFIYSNNVQFRNQFFKQLSLYKGIDAPGNCLNNMAPIGRHKKILDSRNAWNWQAEKIAFLKPYKFTIAFENSSYPGYTTEKLTHAMAAHTVPIYWGNPLVSNEFNPKSFINCHDYPDIKSVIERVKEIDQNEDLYRQYLSEPYFYENTEPESLREEIILDRFEMIFSKGRSYNRKNPMIDRLKRYFYHQRMKWQNFSVNAKQYLEASIHNLLKRK